ncbi:MAG: hydratase [Treponema sp.]|jgi:aconitate hydratase|nr:hydratase [Treponema sp.]
MIKIIKEGAFLLNNGGKKEIIGDIPENREKIRKLGLDSAKERQGTMAAQILMSHNSKAVSGGGTPSELSLKFDALASHDITFVNIIQTAKASGLEKFPVPYILTNCHNSLCAVGGTINEDDHLFGLSAAKRYGGIYVPPNIAVIHSYIRETQAGCGKMILGSDSHTRYGALGTMGVGEGGGELVKQLLGQSYDFAYPKVIAVCLSGEPRSGVGPQDVALSIIGQVFKGGFVKNAVLEFIGEGIASLPADFRIGIDVMTTETACWSSIWETDEIIEEYYSTHYRDHDYKKLEPMPDAYYDGLIHVDLSAIKPMIALPFHPSNVYELDALLEEPADILRQVEKDAAETIANPGIKFSLVGKAGPDKKVRVDQAIVAGCAGGTFDNLMAVRSILGAYGAKPAKGNEGFAISVYPGSQPVYLELAENGALSSFSSQGVITRTAFCGPCFGAGDVPANNALSIRHCTRNFPNREGSRPSDGQISWVCLMDARSIAATARNGGYLASAEKLDWKEKIYNYHFGLAPYLAKVFNGLEERDKNAELCYGPNIADWPPMEALGENLLLKIVSRINDPVTTTDELIPSGETSSYRSNPVRLAEYTLSRKDPDYVTRAKAVKNAAKDILKAETFLPELPKVLEALSGAGASGCGNKLQLGSAIAARKPGDGSAREQAASCQRVLGGLANFAEEYATKRYRSNLINWGIIPFITGPGELGNNDYVFIKGIAEKLRSGAAELDAWIVRPENAKYNAKKLSLKAPELNDGERELLLDGSLINQNKRKLAGGMSEGNLSRETQI